MYVVRADLATRLKQAQSALRSELNRREQTTAMLKAVNETVDPDEVSEAILARFAEWIPAASHAMMAAEPDGNAVMVASRAVPASITPALEKITAWVMRHGESFSSADLSSDPRIGGPACSLLAVPLAGRRPVGALMAFEPAVSSRQPLLIQAVERAMVEVLEPAAAAYESAVRLQRAEALSVTDDLTGLYNSRYLNQALRKESKRAARSGRPLSLLFIDLDGFKAINDCHGHLAGSRALVETGALLRDSARETDIVARFGGDEFAVVLPDTSSPGALLVARRVRQRIAEHRFLESRGLDVHVTASVGVATYPDINCGPEELMAAADKAMYRVKDRGKDGIEIADGESV